MGECKDIRNHKKLFIYDKNNISLFKKEIMEMLFKIILQKVFRDFSL